MTPKSRSECSVHDPHKDHVFTKPLSTRSLALKGMTLVDHPTASWQAMQEGNVFYRRQQCYSIPGKLPELGDYIIAGCCYGGPIGNVNRRGLLF